MLNHIGNRAVWLASSVPARPMTVRIGIGALALILAMLASIAGTITAARADSIRDKQWHLDFLRIAQIHKITKGKSATVAVVDTGVDATHPDLKGNVRKGVDPIDHGDGRSDVDGHGTAMASLIAGRGHGPDGRDGVLGIAPDAEIMPGRHNVRTQGDARDSKADEVIDWIVREGASIINLSFGGAGGLSHVQNALDSDVVVVAASGNAYEGNPAVAVPAAYAGVIAVSGVDRKGKFSEKSARGPEVVLAAPMVDITAAGAGKRGTYATATGTSGAAAIVSGVAALIRANYPDISANGVINRLIRTADDKGPPGRDDKYGFGVINPLKALTADIPDIDYNPLIEGAGPADSPSATTSSDPAAKPGGEQREGLGYLLPLLAGAAALVAIVGLTIYFAMLSRRDRQSASKGNSPDDSPHAGGTVPSAGHPTNDAPSRHGPYMRPPGEG